VSKICHITSVHPRYDVRILGKECVSLAKAGNDVVLLVADGLPQEIYEGVAVYSVKNISKNRVARIISAKRKFIREARSVDAQIYHFHDPELLSLGMKLKKFGKIVIYDSHEDVPRQILAKTWLPKWIRKPISYIFEKYENRIVNKLDAVIVPTPHIRDRFLPINSNTSIIANFPILEEFAHTDNTQKRVQACYVGGITRNRGIYQIAEATSRAETRLLLCGPFESEEVKNDILSRYEHIEYLGVVNRKKIAEVIQSSQMGFVTLLYTPNHFYSYPIKMFEYMAGGIPVIASNFPLWKTIVDDGCCGLTVDPENIDAITDAILRIRLYPGEAEKMGKNGREKVIMEYNWQKQSEILISLYSSVSLPK